MAMFLLNAAAIPVAIASGRPGEFGPTATRTGSAGVSLDEGAETNCLRASRGDVEDSGPQGGRRLQSSTDHERFLWRIDEFERLGFNVAEASDLADSDADLGQARHLLATGCSSTLALQILL